MKKKLLFFLALFGAVLFTENIWGQKLPSVASPFGSTNLNSASNVLVKKDIHAISLQTSSIDVFVDGGNRLVAMQYTDGSWGWPLTAPPTYANILGPIAMGLAQAYQQTGNASQRDALIEAGNYLLTKVNNFSPSDGYLAAQLDKIFNVSTYKNWVITNFYNPLAAGTYNRNGAGTLYTTASYIQAIRDSRTGTSANLAAWDIGMGLVGAAMCGVSTAEWIAGDEAEINELDAGTSGAEMYYDVIGLAGALYGLAYVNQEFDPTAGEHAAASNLMDLANILVSYQINNGGFAWNANWVIPNDNDESMQETAYAILALNQVSRSTFLTNITGAANYIESVQLPTGGFEGYTGSGENNEVTGEALWALNVVSPPPVCNSTRDVYYPLIQSAVDDAAAGNTITVAAGTYNEHVTVDLSLSIIGTGNPTVTEFILTASPVTITGFSFSTDINVATGGDVQDAIDAAPSGGTVDVGSGTYTHMVIDKPLTLNGNGAIITNASPAITVTSNNVTITGFTFVFDDNTIPYNDYAIDVQNNATNIVIHDCNFQNTLNGANGNGVINEGTGTVDATLNYWNSLTGPTISTNPSGTGRIATNSGGGILYYSPWYADFAHLTPTIAGAVLQTPANLATGVSILPIFSWDPIIAPSVTYQLEIATDISFAVGTIVYGPIAVTSPYQLPEAYALDNGTIYYWRITATVGTLTAYSFAKFTTITPAVHVLTNPSNLSTIIGNTIYFSWYSGVVGVQYTLEVSQFNDFHTLVAGFPTAASTLTYYNFPFTYSTLPAGNYYWRVKSYTTTGTLIDISSVWAFIISGPPTAIPTYPVGGTTVYTTAPTLWWYPNNYSYTSGIYYRVRYSTDHSYNLQSSSTTNYYVTLSGLTGGQTYYYVIDASTDAAFGTYTTSLEESFIVYNSTPTDVVVYQSYPVGGQPVYIDTPTLYWYIGMYIPGVSFDLEYSDGSWHSLGTVSNYYYTFTTSLPAGTYSWRVRVHGGTTWYTETFTVNSTTTTVFAPIPVPLSPTGGVTVSSQSPSLSWFAYSASALEYQVIYSSDPTMTGGILTYTTAPNGGSSGWLVATSYSLAGLTPGVTYYWQVRSRLAATPTNISDYSSVAQFTVSPGASPVVVLPANPIVGTNINSTAANLSWVLPAMSSSTLSYDLELAKDPDMNSSIVISNLSQPSYKAENLDANCTYYWRVKSKTGENVVSNYSATASFSTGEVTSIEQTEIVPRQFELQQNFPNPFNPTTRIVFSLPQNTFVSLKIYDMLGREIKSLINYEMQTGYHFIDWNGDNQFGQKVASGMYIYRITAGDFSAVKKMVLIK